MIAWILGWDLILEYGLASSAVASGWSGYLQGLLSGFGITLPTALTSAYSPEAGTYVDLQLYYSHFRTRKPIAFRHGMIVRLDTEYH